MALGCAIEITFGILLNNFGLGITFGAALGLVFGAAFGMKMRQLLFFDKKVQRSYMMGRAFSGLGYVWQLTDRSLYLTYADHTFLNLLFGI